MRALVSGASGFIGSHLVKYLTDRGDEVLQVDKIIPGSPDLLEVDVFGEVAIKFKPNLIVHLGANSHTAVLPQEQNRILAENITGTWSVLRAASLCGGCRVILAGSASEYGPNAVDWPWNEDDRPMALDPYGLSKLIGTQLGRAHEGDAVTVRFSNVYGGGQRPPKLIPTMLVRAMANETITMNGNGLPIRNWLHVGDAIEAIVTIADTRDFGPSVFNVGGSAASNIELASLLLDELRIGFAKIGRKLRPNEEILILSSNPGGTARVDLDSRLIKDHLGWEAKVQLKDGIRETIHHHLKDLIDEHSNRAA